MKRKSDLPVYLAMQAAGLALRALPRPWSLGAAGVLGRGVRVLGLRRLVTDENLAVAFPELSAEQRAGLADRVYAHFARMAADSLRLSSLGPSAVEALVHSPDRAGAVRRALEGGRGVIVLTGHIGNWELAGSYLAAIGVPLSAVVKPPSNPYLAAQAEATRKRLGIEAIPMPEARSGVLHALRANRAVALVADQGALRSRVWSPFFGRPTKTPEGPGLFAVRTGAPVVFGGMLARPDGGYALEVETMIDRVTGDAATAIQLVADRFRAELERLVRRVPEQYLWTHRLWKQAPAAVQPGAR